MNKKLDDGLKFESIKIELPMMTHNCIVMESYPLPEAKSRIAIVIYDKYRSSRDQAQSFNIDINSNNSKELMMNVFKVYGESIFNQLKQENLK